MASNARIWIALALSTIGTQSALAQEGLFVAPPGNVGINTTAPGYPLTVMPNSGDSTLLSLEGPNSNATQMRFLTSQNEWTVRAHGNGGKFRIDEVNTAGVAFDLTPAGAVTLANGLTTNGPSQMNGDLTVGTVALPQTLTINGTFQNLSSRQFKTDITPVNSRDMLRRVIELPIYSWRYKSEENAPAQIGPMAEDVQAKVGIGDGNHLVVGTTAGVSLAAIRGLNEIVEENARELADLRTRNAQLQERLATLEARLAR